MNRQAPNRWGIASAALVMQLCLGVLYSWAVFRAPLAQLHGWPKTVTIAPYRWSLLFFTIGMIVAGFWQDRKGPRLVGSFGGLLLGAGCLLASLIGHTPSGLIFSYGVVGGLGVGFAYVTPIATCIKWFPDRRGFIVGLAVMGFGVGSLVFAPLLEALIGKDPAFYASTIPRAFLVLSAIFFVFVIGAAQVFRVPPSGWRPSGWTPPAVSAFARTEIGPGKMLRTPQFYLLWLLYFLGTSVGLTAIGESTPLIQEMSKDAALSGGAALGIMSLFNGLGRLSWGSLSDRLGRGRTVACMCAVSVLACLGPLRNSSGFWEFLAGLCLVGFAYGGYLAVMPSFTADFYGPRNIGANYGLLFSAWGLCGFIVPGYFASVMERARLAGNLAAGYKEVYASLAGFAVVGGLLALFARTPASRREPEAPQALGTST